MSMEAHLEHAELLLEQLVEHTAEIAAEIGPAEMSKLLQTLDLLATEANEVQTAVQLSRLVEELVQLKTAIPSLCALLEALRSEEPSGSHPVVRSVELEDFLDDGGNTYAIYRAAQLANAVLDVHEKLKIALREAGNAVEGGGKRP